MISEFAIDQARGLEHGEPIHIVVNHMDITIVLPSKFKRMKIVHGRLFSMYNMNKKGKVFNMNQVLLNRSQLEDQLDNQGLQK